MICHFTVFFVTLNRLSFLPSSCMQGNWLIFTISFSWLKSTTSEFFSVMGKESQMAPLRMFPSNCRIRVCTEQCYQSLQKPGCQNVFSDCSVGVQHLFCLFCQQKQKSHINLSRTRTFQ